MNPNNGPSPLLDWAVAARALPGQAVSGDRHLVRPYRNGVLVAVVDGVGHGDEAAAAARTAVATLSEYPTEPVIWLVKRCHQALAMSRGVVMTVASLHALEGTMTWVGVGNVEAILVRADTRANPATERVLLRGGLVGHQLPPLHASVIPVNSGDLLVFASDGIRSDFLEHVGATADSPQQVADRVLNQHFKGLDDALVLVARYGGVRDG